MQLLSTQSRFQRLAGWLFVVIAVVSCLALAQTLFVPIVMAALIALLLHIPLKSLARLGVPSILGVIALIAIFGSLAWTVIVLLIEPLGTFASDYRAITQQLRDRIFSLQSSFNSAAEMGNALAEVGDDVARSLEDPAVQEVVVREGNFLVRAASSLAESATTFVATLTICAFILTIRNPFTTIATLGARDFPTKLKAARIWREVEGHVSYYFLITTCINAGLGVVVGTSLYLLDVPLASFWGVLVGLLNYMPFLGPTIGALSLLAFCLLQFTAPAAILLPAAVYLFINFIEANFVTPALIGRKAEIPPITVILSLFFWGWLWGFIGLVVAIPVLVIVNALSVHIEAMRPIKRVLMPRR